MPPISPSNHKTTRTAMIVQSMIPLQVQVFALKLRGDWGRCLTPTPAYVCKDRLIGDEFPSNIEHV
jgi:hypothetical protein